MLEDRIIRGRPSKSISINKISEKDVKQTTLNIIKANTTTNRRNEQVEICNTDLLDMLLQKMDTIGNEIESIKEELKKTREENLKMTEIIKRTIKLKRNNRKTRKEMERRKSKSWEKNRNTRGNWGEQEKEREKK